MQGASVEHEAYRGWIDKVTSRKRQPNEDREVGVTGLCRCRHVERDERCGGAELDSFQLKGSQAVSKMMV